MGAFFALFNIHRRSVSSTHVFSLLDTDGTKIPISDGAMRMLSRRQRSLSRMRLTKSNRHSTSPWSPPWTRISNPRRDHRQGKGSSGFAAPSVLPLHVFDFFNLACFRDPGTVTWKRIRVGMMTKRTTQLKKTLRMKTEEPNCTNLP